MPGNCRPSLRRKTLHNVKLITNLSDTDKKCIENAFDKLDQLDELGLTIEDIKALKENNTPKKLECSEWYPNDRDCPNCGSNLVSYDGSINNCPYCGQALDEGIKVI